MYPGLLLQIESGVKCHLCLLNLQVDNGTEWLHLGGELNTFLPIVSHHSNSVSTSDLSLRSALQIIRDTKVKSGTKIGVHISFLTPSIVPASLSAISAITDPPLPLLVSAT